MNIDGASSRDRIVEFELSDFYNEHFSPEDDFGLWLFTGFSRQDWVDFDNFMMSCLADYFRLGLISPAAKNLLRRKMIQTTCQEFVEFINEKFTNEDIRLDWEFEKHELHQQFLNDYPEFREHRLNKQLTVFTKFCKRYAQFSENISRIEERKSGKDRFITFISDKKEKFL